MGMSHLFWNLTLKDMILSVASYDERSLERDPSVHCGNQITYLNFVKKKKESLIKNDIVT